MSRYQRTRDEARIRAAIGAMPYGGLERIRAASNKVGLAFGHPAPVELEQIADYLEALQGRLAEIAKESQARDTELGTLRAQRDAVRQFLGIGDGS